MSDTPQTGQILVYTLPEQAQQIDDDYNNVRGDYDTPRNLFSRPKPTPMPADQLKDHLKVFLVDMETVLQAAPPEVGGFKLTEIEISAGITVGGEIALIGIGSVKGEITGGLKFVLKRS